MNFAGYFDNDYYDDYDDDDEYECLFDCDYYHDDGYDRDHDGRYSVSNHQIRFRPGF